MARTIWLMFDLGHEWPLWESCDKYTMEPSDYGLSPNLTGLLRACYDLWFEHFDSLDGWDTPEAEREWADLGRRALAILRREVADIGDVVDHHHLAPQGRGVPAHEARPRPGQWW